MGEAIEKMKPTKCKKVIEARENIKKYSADARNKMQEATVKMQQELDKKKFLFMGDKIKIKKALAPTNIIWENLEVSCK